MRATLIPLLLLTAACRQHEAAPEEPVQAPETSAVTAFAGTGRDRLCLKEEEGRAAFITYAAQGDTNCSVRGSASDGPAIRPDGDTSCAIPFDRQGDRITLGAGGEACAYYCGPGASFEGKSFVRMDKAEPVTDIAGDPLC